ncbi:MAG: D-isomer specific 2-hydroxyacid dehydrogenase family protein [Candidatus Shapirobacteria bacterium]
MKIYCTVGHECFTPSQKSELEKLGEVTYIEEIRIDEDKYISLVKDAEIIIAAPESMAKLSEKILSSLPNLKFITLITVGFNWVDQNAAQKLNIPISNVKGANSESVAEHIWGMILDLSKRISEFDRDIRNDGAFEFSKYKGHELYGKTLGLIGTGDIGSKVARIAQAFDMRILGFNKNNRPIDGVEMVDLNTLLSQSDIVNISIPLNDSTQSFISSQQIKLMKDKAILINCAREKLVNKEAVISFIKSGKLGGYGVETPIMTPIPRDDEYLKYSNIIINVHNAFNTVESDEKCYGLAVENIKNYLLDNPKNLI